MLLGIALHAALSFVAIPWIVQDRNQHILFGVFVEAVHGFRMPLFFLLSGFFTAMLWRRRGMRALIRHRVRRILLPLLVGCVTIVPLMWGLVVAFGESKPGGDGMGQKDDVWSLSRRGDAEGVDKLVERGVDLDVADPVFGQSPLAWAVIGDQPAMVLYLIEAGADPSARFKEGSTPLHTAAFFGRVRCADALLAHDVDVDALNDKYDTPLAVLEYDRQTTAWVADLVKAPFDWEAIEEGRTEIAEKLKARGANPDTERHAVPQFTQSILSALVEFPLFHHLWFLAFLCWLVAGFVLVVTGWQALHLPGLPMALVRAPWCWLWIVPLTLWPQLSMHGEGARAGFGPDTSAGLLPMPHVLLYYAIFFGFGAWYFLSDDREGRLGRWWPVHLLLGGLVVFPLGAGLAHFDPELTALVGDEGRRRWLSALAQVLYVWMLTFGLMGLARRVLSVSRPWIRYLSDASYWLYLTHLPLVLILQQAVRDLPIPGLWKFLGILVATLVPLLFLYQVCVRYTWVGRMLNGPRERPG